MLIAIASDDAYALGVLSSKFHVSWALRSGGWLGIGNDPRYSESYFRSLSFSSGIWISKGGYTWGHEDLDAHRKRVLEEHPKLTLTGLYNVLEMARAGVQPDALEPHDRLIFDEGLVLILKELHDRLDEAVADAYGWPTDLSDEEILVRLVALNREQAREEAEGAESARFGGVHRRPAVRELDQSRPVRSAARCTRLRRLSRKRIFRRTRSRRRPRSCRCWPRLRDRSTQRRSPRLSSKAAEVLIKVSAVLHRASAHGLRRRARSRQTLSSYAAPLGRCAITAVEKRATWWHMQRDVGLDLRRARSRLKRGSSGCIPEHMAPPLLAPGFRRRAVEIGESF